MRSAAGLGPHAGRDRVVRCVLDSLAAATARVVGRLHASEVTVVGGGAADGLLMRLLGDACGVPVRRGPVEAAALGNALVQGIALGRYPDLAGARAALTGAR